jgi:hypothetical protein
MLADGQSRLVNGMILRIEEHSVFLDLMLIDVDKQVKDRYNVKLSIYFSSPIAHRKIKAILFEKH